MQLNKWGAWLGAGAILFTFAGCADRNKNGQPDDVATAGEVAKTTEKAGDAVENAAGKAGDAVENAAGKAVDATKNAAGDVADATKNAAGKVGDAAKGAVTTPSIKTALGAQKALGGSSIDVDTNVETKTVTLKGTVKNAAQKTLAAAVAKKNAPGFKIVNNLK